MEDLLRDPAASEEGLEEAAPLASAVDANVVGTEGSDDTEGAGDGDGMMNRERIKGYGGVDDLLGLLGDGVNELVYVESRGVPRRRGGLEARERLVVRFAARSR